MPDAYELPTRIDEASLLRLKALADRQCAVARRDELYQAGVSRPVLDSMLESGRWRARGQIVVIFHNGPLTREQQIWAAVRNAGSPSAVAARTAAAGYGLTGWESECVEIVVPKGTLIPRGLGIDVKVHESRRFSAADLHPGRALPQVRVERALVDAAVWSTTPRTACGVLAAGVQQRLTTPDRLLTELAAAGAVRHRRVLARALVDIAGGAQAVSEIDFIRFCRRNRLPPPVMQECRRDSSGRRRYLDATFEAGDGRLVRVEIDGALHLVVSTYWTDMARGNELVIGGERVLRLPSYVIYANDPVAVDQIRRALNLSGSERRIAG